MQTAELAGVGTSVLMSIIEDLAAKAEKRAATAINSLPERFPDQLISSVMAGITDRVRHLAEVDISAAAD